MVSFLWNGDNDPKVKLTKVSLLTNIQEFQDNINTNRPRFPYRHLLNPLTEVASNRCSPVGLPWSHTFLVPNQSELVELSDINNACQVVQRIPLDSYGYPKEEYYIGNNSISVIGESLWVEISRRKEDFPSVLIEQRLSKPDRPYCVYEVGRMALYAIDPVRHRLFLFRRNPPMVHIYDLSKKKITIEYPMQEYHNWGLSALYNPSLDIIFVDTLRQSGGGQINIFSPDTGKIRPICNGWDIRQGPDDEIYFTEGKRMYRYQVRTQIRELIYAAPQSADLNSRIEIGRDPSYVRFLYDDSGSYSYRADIDLKRNEYQIRRFDVQSYIKSFLAQNPKKPRVTIDIDMSDETFWRQVD